MKPRILPLLCMGFLLLPAAAWAQPQQEYSYAQIYFPNSTVDLIPSTSSAGYSVIDGIKCNFSGATPIRVEFNIDGNATSFIIDPSYLPQESSGSGQYLTDWIPLFTPVRTSVHVQLNNTGLGTSTVNCWASWSLD
jgi:hypothetical protein